MEKQENDVRKYGRMIFTRIPLFAWCLLCLFFSCRGDEVIILSETNTLPGEELNPDADPVGMYLLNEANMGSNKASIDYLDLQQAVYVRNLYAERNPNVVKELGDVGNDIQIYGGRLYVVVNCSNKVEVMEAATGKRIGQVDIPNCRYVRFHEGMAYVSSYVGAVQPGSDATKGAVYKVDTLTLQIKDKVTVGYQPEEMEVIDNYLYVANSGGYRPPEYDYDYTLSVINLESFRQVELIPVGINLHRVRQDRYGQLWVTSRGDKKQIPSNLFVLERKKSTDKMVVADTLDIPCSNLAVCGDSVYVLSVQWKAAEGRNEVSYGIVDIRTRKLVNTNFITDGTEKNITVPYSIIVHPVSKDIYVTDAKNYVTSGRLHCYTKEGRLKWSVRTGDIPAAMVFRMKPSKPELG